MKQWFLAAATLLLIQGADAREHWGPPPLCPQPKVECCKPKACKPKKCCKAPRKKECAPKCKPKCEPKPCCEKPCPPVCPIVLNPAYNQAASIDIPCGWDTWIDASFTYFEAIEDDLSIALKETGTDIAGVGISDGQTVSMDHEYKPGFKVGIGFNSHYDDWDLYAGYTWFRSKVHTNASAPQGGVLVPIVGHSFVTNGASFNTVNSSWKANFDFVDARLGRSYYVGKKLTFHPYFGARAAWMRQSWNNTFNNINITSPPSTETNNQSFRSWGVGPEAGLNTNWNLCYGLRMFGNGQADILFTQYTKFKAVNSSTASNRVINVREEDINTLRAHMDLGLGLGWGRYFHCRKWYFDLSAEYNFQVFFTQSIFRTFGTSGISQASNGNLYLHGLTVTTKFEF